MKSKSAKAKGRRLQDWVAEDISATFHLPPEAVRGAIMGERGTDIKIDLSFRRQFPYSVEAKNRERINIWTAIGQAKTNTAPETTPAIVVKRNRLEPWVLIPWDHFLALTSYVALYKERVG